MSCGHGHYNLAWLDRNHRRSLGSYRNGLKYLFSVFQIYFCQLKEKVSERISTLSESRNSLTAAASRPLTTESRSLTFTTSTSSSMTGRNLQSSGYIVVKLPGKEQNWTWAHSQELGLLTLTTVCNRLPRCSHLKKRLAIDKLKSDDCSLNAGAKQQSRPISC